MDTLSNNERHRPPPVGSRIRAPPRCPLPVHTVTEELDTRVSQPLSFSPVLPSTSTLPGFVVSILVYHSLRRTLNAHDTRRSTLLCPLNWLRVCDGVSPKSCMSLGVMPCEASSLGTCTSNGVRPKLVSVFLRHVFLHSADSRF